ncbi:tryptophan synthase subunit alpha [Buchnera aphidicola]|uniref:tryptophan synthase subunit alpha n=1 Tax=Buchnera aphidicola TaxID=9 RepID=UPI003464E48F
MNRYQNMFHKLKSKKEGCLVPFLTIGDPSVESFLKIIDILIEEGIDAIELGIPFSDPLADGPIIQNANLRALKNGINIFKAFEIIQYIRKKYYTLPIGILVYANIIFHTKINMFYKLCKEIDIDSVLIPDIPIEEYFNFHKDIILDNISSIFICPPNANKILLKKISKIAKGYIYLLSRSGVTGHQDHINQPKINIIQQLKKYSTIPILQGFGIFHTSQILSSLSLGVDGIICGSVIIESIEKYQNNPEFMIQTIRKLIKKFKNATKNQLKY